MTPAAPAQCAANIAAWFTSYGLGKHEPFELEQDRCYYRKTEEIMRDIRILVVREKLLPAAANNHGDDVEFGYREDVPGVSAQVIVHTNKVEIDFDFANPTRDLVGVIKHTAEVLANKIRKQLTDPFEVAKRLRERGINVGHEA